MTVGIISMQRICNYGSYLQAYGLKKMIESLGHDVVFIDYQVGRPLLSSKKEEIKYIIDRYKKKAIRAAASSKLLLSLLPNSYKNVAYSYHAFRNEYWPILGLSPQAQYHTQVDVLVIGSDEVFNCLQNNPDVGYSLELFGKNANANKIITYAASFGNVTYDALVAANKVEEIRKLVAKYAAISVRDNNSASIIRKMLPDRTVNENLDPVLMFDFSKRKKKKVGITNYIIVYAYRGRLTAEEINAIKAFAAKENKLIISIGGYHSFADQYIQTSPFHVLDYFENADYVITDTFHGTIFSIISHTKFGVLVRNGHGKVYGNSEKLNDLLLRINAENRIIKRLEKLPMVVKADISFESIDNTINEERKKTKSYLKSSLLGDNNG